MWQYLRVFHFQVNTFSSITCKHYHNTEPVLSQYLQVLSMWIHPIFCYYLFSEVINVSNKSKYKESCFRRHCTVYFYFESSLFCKNKVLPFHLDYLLSTTMKSSFGKDCPKDQVVVRVQTREVGLYVSLWFILSYWDMGVHNILLDRQRAGWKNTTTKKIAKW